MRKMNTLLAIAALLGVLTAPETYAQRGPQRGAGHGWGRQSQYTRLYNTNTVETITGEVVSVEKFTPADGMGSGVHLLVKTDKETISVHLGPSWFIDNQDTKVGPKDKLEIKGSRVTFQEKPAIIAAEIKKGDEILKLRDDAGIPAWAGWRGR